ncbi:uncharacterized protein LOC142343980 isoform X2 [Convolutriloba macropyga]
MDNQHFYDLVTPAFRNINWFSLVEDEEDPCCLFQTWVYQETGRRKGFDPHEYFSKLTDFSSEGKHLNHIMAEYNSTLCLNVIYQLGFGTGGLTLRGDFQSNTFIILPQNYPDVHLFHASTIQQYLTFDWFKENYICIEQPWICTIEHNQTYYLT